MKKIIKRSYAIFILVGAFFIMLGILGVKYFINGAVWAASSLNNHIFSNGVLTTAGTVYDKNGVILSYTEDGKRKYNENFNIRVSTLHVVGDKSGIISSGAQTIYRSQLIGYDKVNGLFNTISGKENGLKLTIDSAVNSAAYSAMDGKKGAVLVYNYKTGEIACAVSAPSFDPSNPPSNDALNNSSHYEGVYINRCFSGLFTPGSTMKIVTAISALENIDDIESQNFNCKGSVVIDGETVVCSGTHGKQNFEQALNHSCNVAFAEISQQLGVKKLTATMKELGMSTALNVGKLSGAKCYFDYSKATKAEFGWAAVGQYNTLVTPLNMVAIAGTIANGGNYVSPYFVAQEPSIIGTLLEKSSLQISIDPTIASKIDKLLRSNVVNQYGDKSFPNLQMAGKTGSAERGKQNGYTLRHNWFVGYSQRADFPYAVVVILENMTYGSGYKNAVPVANKVLQKLLSQQGLK